MSPLVPLEVSPLVPLEVLPSLKVLCYCFDKHSNLYAITDDPPTLHIVKPGVNEESYVIPYSGPYKIYPNFSGDKIFIVTNTDVFFIDVKETNRDPFTTSLKSNVVVKAICSDKDDNIYFLCLNDAQDGLLLFVCTYSKSTFVFEWLDNINTSISSDLFVIPSTQYYIFALTNGTIITANDQKIFASDQLIYQYAIIEHIFASGNTIYRKVQTGYNMDGMPSQGDNMDGMQDLRTFLLSSGYDRSSESVLWSANNFDLTAMCVDRNNKLYMSVRTNNNSDATIFLYDSKAKDLLVLYAYGAATIDMKFDPKYGELYTLNSYGELYVYEEPRTVSDNIFDMSVSCTPLDLPLDLYISYTHETTCQVVVNTINSGIWEITYKPNDPALEPIETKITGEFTDTVNAFHHGFYRTIYNLQPEMNYLVRAKIYSNDKTYVSDELEFRTLAFDPPMIDMKINKNKDILFSLGTIYDYYKDEEDPLPSDASYYIAYFQGTIPKQLIFHRVNGSLYILPDTFSLDKNKKLYVVAFIRYGYEIDDKDLIDDLRASMIPSITLAGSNPGDTQITLDNIPQTNSSAYSYRPNTRRGVLTEDQYPHPQYS
jgi:hypothetical protein